MPEVQYLVFTDRQPQIALKGEARRIGNPLLEFDRSGGNYLMRLSGFIQEPWDAAANPGDHLDFYIHQDLVDDLEAEIQAWAGPCHAQQYPAANPRWFPGGRTRLFYVFDRSEVAAQQVLIDLVHGPHGPCHLVSNGVRLFVDREVPQRGRGMQGRFHFGVMATYGRLAARPGSAHDLIELVLSQREAQMLASAVQYAIEQHRVRNP